jgi:exodeoxyribonuclease VIII
MIRYNLPYSAYAALPGLRSSDLKLLLRSPAHFAAPAVPRETTPAQALGIATHTAILEPGKWEHEVAVSPSLDRRTKAGKEAWAAFNEVNGDRLLISKEQQETVNGLAASVHFCEWAQALLEGTHREASITETLDGLDVKVRPDAYAATHIIDLKTTSDASPAGFARQAAQLGYHVQAAFYLDVLDCAAPSARDWYWIAVESSPPYVVQVYAADCAMIERGRELDRRALDRYREATASGIWGGYARGIETLRLPAWAAQDWENLI